MKTAACGRCCMSWCRVGCFKRSECEINLQAACFLQTHSDINGPPRMTSTSGDRYFEAGDFLCEASFGHSPSWLSYLLAVGTFATGGVFIVGAFPMLWGKVKGDFEGGVAGTAIGGIFIAISLAAFLIPQFRKKGLRVIFHTNGLLLRHERDLQFVAYQNCTEFSVKLFEPSDATRASAMNRGTFSLLIGNWAGLGASIAKSQATGSIHFVTASEKPVIATGISVPDLKRIAKHASTARGAEVLERSEI